MTMTAINYDLYPNFIGSNFIGSKVLINHPCTTVTNYVKLYCFSDRLFHADAGCKFLYISWRFNSDLVLFLKKEENLWIMKWMVWTRDGTEQWEVE